MREAYYQGILSGALVAGGTHRQPEFRAELAAFLELAPELARDLLAKTIERGVEPSVRLLIDAGLSVNENLGGGRTPLMLAVRHGQQRIAEWLIAAGADVDAEDAAQSSVLEQAIAFGSAAQVALLVDAGADAQRARGRASTLFWAISYGNPAMVQLVVGGGADLGWVNCDGEDALLWSIAHNRDRLWAIPVLAELGVDLDAPRPLPGAVGLARTPMVVAASDWFRGMGEDHPVVSLLRLGASSAPLRALGDLEACLDEPELRIVRSMLLNEELAGQMGDLLAKDQSGEHNQNHGDRLEAAPEAALKKNPRSPAMVL